MGVVRYGQAHLPGLARIDKKPVPAKRSERAMQPQGRAVLSGVGYHTMEVGAGRKTVKCVCEECGHENEIVPDGWQGNTPGFPDLCAFRWQNFPPVFIPIELKGNAKTPVTKEQKALSDAGRYPLAYTLEAAVQAVLNAEIAMDAYRFPIARRVQLETFLKENAGHLW